MSALTFRRAVEADVPVMMRIRLDVRENRLSNPARVTPAMCIDYLDALGRGWVAERDGEIIGFSYAARDGSIWALFVDPAREGLGAGTTSCAWAPRRTRGPTASTRRRDGRVGT